MSLAEISNYTTPGEGVELFSDRPLVFAYTNYRSEQSVRTARIVGLRFARSDWHPEPQWLVRAFDLDKNAEREFALKDMRPV